MAKNKTIYVCQECGAESSKWVGRCISCNSWNTFIEEVKIVKSASLRNIQVIDSGKSVPQKISEIKSENYKRISTGINELDRILGGGMVPGSFILLGGEPGIGKSTLALQLALETKEKVLYVSGEESGGQIKMRAERIGKQNESCLLYNETHLQDILVHFNNQKPTLLVIDSIQTIYSSLIESVPGSVSQVRECAATLLKVAKESKVPILLIGHITKDGSLAGPKVLEHIVDTVIQFEGDQHLQFRVLRTLKNRFGAVPELAIFEMNQTGLHEVLNPAGYFLHESGEHLSGIAIGCIVDGIKPILVEVQALVSSAVYGTPQRTATGFEGRRLNMLLAVLEKKAGLNVSSKDVFLNIAGGIKIQDTATDLAVIAAIVSSRTDKEIMPNTCCCAEVSLTGELKPVSRIEHRLTEAIKLGYKRFVISSYHKDIPKNGNVEIKKASSLNDALRLIFNT